VSVLPDYLGRFYSAVSAFGRPGGTSSRARRRTFASGLPEQLEVRVLLSSGGVAESSIQLAPPTSQPAITDRVRLLQSFNPNAGLHFYTTSEFEHSVVVRRGHVDEASNRTGIDQLLNQEAGSLPVLRLHNPNNGQHYLTLNPGERDFLVSAGWLDEGTQHFLFPAFEAGTVAVNHLYNTISGDHFFSGSAAELAIVLAQPGWVMHGQLGFGYLGAPLASSGFATGTQLDQTEVDTLLKRASALSASNEAIIAVVDRGGKILGVRVQSNVPAMSTEDRVFSIDGAVALARTAAFFSNNEAPLTSRTIRHISQSTLTQSEVESNPNDPDVNRKGPGFVGPVGVGGHFPPGVTNAPQVDLFGIEHTNRDSLLMPGLDGIKGTPDDVNLTSRFEADFIPGQEIFAPESYGYASGVLTTAQSRGIATLPGGIPLYRNGDLVGGIGVFFPGPKGYATFSQGFVAGVGQTESERTNASRILEAEAIAFGAAGGSSGAGASVGTVDGVPPLPGFDLPFGRIDLVGITLEIYGPIAGVDGVRAVTDLVDRLPIGSKNNGTNAPVTVSQGMSFEFTVGASVPSGWLVAPKSSLVDPTLTASVVNEIITNGVNEATRVRAQIRLPLGTRTKMVLSVADSSGEVLGLFRMPDATVFSIDVAVTKARNTEYYADADELNPVDQLPGVDPGAAFTNRTFRYLAQPRFPNGIDGTSPPPFSTLNEAGINPATAENIAGHVPVLGFQTVLGFDSGHVGRNFRNTTDDLTLQSGIVFFPGSTPLYVNEALVGGFGVSGDGVDQDDVVTVGGSRPYLPPSSVRRADQVFFNDVRLPYFKFPRNPFA
jgi:uncharacterized protein GlcG (DUF336 family)